MQAWTVTDDEVRLIEGDKKFGGFSHPSFRLGTSDTMRSHSGVGRALA